MPIIDDTDEVMTWDISQVVTGNAKSYERAWGKAIVKMTRYTARQKEGALSNHFEVLGEGESEQDPVYYELVIAPWGITCSCPASVLGGRCCYHGAGLAQALGMSYGTVGGR